MAARFGMEVLESRTLFAAAPPFTFAPLAAYPTGGQRAQRLAVGDFNGDGFPDVATVNRNSNSISVFINEGNGTFLPAVTYRVLEPDNLVAGDFLGNGKIDLAVVCAEPNTLNATNLFANNNNSRSGLSIFVGNGDGTFNPTPIDYRIFQSTHSLVEGDFNHDGLMDLALTTAFGVGVILNEGNGLFANEVVYHVGAGTASYITAADLSGNGNLDIILSKGSNARIRILMGNSDGTFALSSASYRVGGTNPISIAVGDVNNDGKPDLVAAGNGYKQGLRVLLGNGDGTFGPSVATPFKGFLQFDAVGDLGGNGILDAVAIDFTSSVQVFAGNGDGTFAAPTQEPGGNEGLALALADVNDDGKPDILFTRHNTLYVLLNTTPTP